MTFNRFELELQARGGRIRELEEELRVVKADLQQEKEEKVDLVTEKVRERPRMGGGSSMS